MIGSGRAWATWLVASLCLLFQFVVQVQPSVMIPALEQDLSLSAEQLGFLTSSYFISYLICQIPSGWLLDRVGPRVVLASSLALSMGGLVWFGSAQSLESAVAARVALGVFGAPAFPAAALIASRWFHPRRFTLMLGLTESFTLLGGVLVDVGLPALVSSTGRQGSGWILGGCALGLGVLGWWLMRNHPSDGSKIDPADDRAQLQPVTDRSALRVLVDPRIWLAAIHGGLFFAVIATFGGLWGVPFLHLRLGIETSSAAHVLAILFVAGAIGAPLIGLAAGRSGLRSVVLMIASLACTGSAFGLVLFTEGTTPVYVMLVIIGFFSGAYALDLAFVIDMVSPRHQGIAMGLANLVLGVVGGPLMIMLIARAIAHSGGDSGASVLDATLDQMNAGLSWFAWGIALLIPLGIILMLCARGSSRQSSYRIQ
ncbi:MAG: MFS transporter [Planctomycetota bacterium]|nr:MFS transporter [Planctomycetota bacterium]